MGRPSKNAEPHTIAASSLTLAGSGAAYFSSGTATLNAPVTLNKTLNVNGGTPMD